MATATTNTTFTQGPSSPRKPVKHSACKTTRNLLKLFGPFSAWLAMEQMRKGTQCDVAEALDQCLAWTAESVTGATAAYESFVSRPGLKPHARVLLLFQETQPLRLEARPHFPLLDVGCR